MDEPALFSVFSKPAAIDRKPASTQTTNATDSAMEAAIARRRGKLRRFALIITSVCMNIEDIGLSRSESCGDGSAHGIGCRYEAGQHT